MGRPEVAVAVRVKVWPITCAGMALKVIDCGRVLVVAKETSFEAAVSPARPTAVTL